MKCSLIVVVLAVMVLVAIPVSSVVAGGVGLGVVLDQQTNTPAPIAPVTIVVTLYKRPAGDYAKLTGSGSFVRETAKVPVGTYGSASWKAARDAERRAQRGESPIGEGPSDLVEYTRSLPGVGVSFSDSTGGRIVTPWDCSRGIVKVYSAVPHLYDLTISLESGLSVYHLQNFGDDTGIGMVLPDLPPGGYIITAKAADMGGRQDNKILEVWRQGDDKPGWVGTQLELVVQAPLPGGEEMSPAQLASHCQGIIPLSVDPPTVATPVPVAVASQPAAAPAESAVSPAVGTVTPSVADNATEDGPLPLADPDRGTLIVQFKGKATGESWPHLYIQDSRGNYLGVTADEYGHDYLVPDDTGRIPLINLKPGRYWISIRSVAGSGSWHTDDAVSYSRRMYIDLPADVTKVTMTEGK